MSDENISEKKVVLFKLDNQEFGVDINEVKEIVKVPEITAVPESANYVEGIISLRGTITAIINLEKKLHMEVRAQQESSRVIIVEHDTDTIGMLVDECSEVFAIPANKIQDTHSSIVDKISAEYVSGVAVLEDERIIIMLDLAKVLSEEEFKQEVKKHVKEHQKK